MNVLLSKYKKKKKRVFAPVYFNFTTKTTIGFEDSLDKLNFSFD